MNSQPSQILEEVLEISLSHLLNPIIKNKEILGRVELVCKSPQNRACSRFLLACLLAKLHNPKLDIRKPYTEIGSKDSYSGRRYDEAFITPFIVKNDLPCNYTTAFLTPAFRNRNSVLTPKMNLVGRPADVYKATLELLEYVYSERVKEKDLLTEIIRTLLLIRKDRLNRMTNLLDSLKQNQHSAVLSAEGITTLIQQHLNCPNSSRLPVLVVVSIYKTAENNLGERVLPLYSHNAADRQTGSLGDVQITLLDDDQIVTTYEMKDRTVVQEDIDGALKKIAESKVKIDNYIIVTTEPISPVVNDYAKSMYEKTGGIEIAILDCLGLLRHFLHLFYRLRSKFLDEYQVALLKEPDSAVREELKEAFLALRKATESIG